MFHDLHKKALAGDRRALARMISLVENGEEGYETVLQSLSINPVPVIGITGPPGAGKSTLISSLLKYLTGEGKKNKIAVIAIDPTSPFTKGALLGDRLRMNEHFNNHDIYIRSLATRGALGGLSAKALEAVYVLKSMNFDYIFIETVGVGQSEIDIVSLADITVVVFVPESGDEIQALKSGIMEIADVFAVNKSDRDGSAAMVKNIQLAMHERKSAEQVPVLKTNAVSGEGIEQMFNAIASRIRSASPSKQTALLARHAFTLIQHNRMKDVSLTELHEGIEAEIRKGNFNIYSFILRYQ